MSTNNFVYRDRLDAGAYTRVLNILPDSRVDDIKCTLSIVNLDDAPSFTAISYRWGDPNEMTYASIQVDGVSFQVTGNCHHALWQAFSHGIQTVWTDSICINQSDNTEKSHQVAMMGRIYRSCSRVVACIGPLEPGSSSEWVWETLDKIDAIRPTLPMTDDSEIKALQYRYSALFDDEVDPQDLCFEVFEFENEYPYWERLWIVQELAGGYSNSIEVLCGEKRMAWSTFQDMAIIHQDICQNLRPWALNFASSKGESKLTKLIELIEASPCNLSRLLRLGLATQKCSNPLDLIYGVLGLIRWPDGVKAITPDYNRSALDLTLEALDCLNGEATAVLAEDAVDLAFCLRLDPDEVVATYISVSSIDFDHIALPCQVSIAGAARIVETEIGSLEVRSEREYNIAKGMHEGRRSMSPGIAGSSAKAAMVVPLYWNGRLSAFCSSGVRGGDIIVDCVALGLLVLREAPDGDLVLAGLARREYRGQPIANHEPVSFWDSYRHMETDWPDVKLTIWLTKLELLALALTISEDGTPSQYGRKPLLKANLISVGNIVHVEPRMDDGRTLLTHLMLHRPLPKHFIKESMDLVR